MVGEARTLTSIDSNPLKHKHFAVSCRALKSAYFIFPNNVTAITLQVRDVV